MAEPMAVSQHFIAWKCDNSEKLNSWFLYNWLQLNKAEFERQAVGSTIKTIGLPYFKKLKIAVPPYSEQKKIAKILSTWDKAIATSEQLLANSKQQKKALMQQLLTGKKRLLDKNGVRFSGEWKRVELGDLLDYQQPTPYLVESTEYSDDFPTPVLTAGKTFILGYTDEESGIFSEQLPAIIFDDFTTDSKFVDFPFKAKSSAMKILTSKDGVSIRFVYEAMQLLDFAVGGHQRHWISIYSRLVIPFPVKEEQQKIAAVLSTADQEISTLQQKLEALKQEKKALMQQLLTGKRRVNIN
ncbi:putative type IC restriction-modification system specificity subunit [Vibrio paracholerae 87395]|nr:putative type IC restriction-modification system specificity subunit [Vibrio paracholerae 87395]